jgi:hypothetical protein
LRARTSTCETAQHGAAGGAYFRASAKRWPGAWCEQLERAQAGETPPDSLAVCAAGHLSLHRLVRAAGSEGEQRATSKSRTQGDWEGVLLLRSAGFTKDVFKQKAVVRPPGRTASRTVGTVRLLCAQLVPSAPSQRPAGQSHDAAPGLACVPWLDRPSSRLGSTRAATAPMSAQPSLGRLRFGFFGVAAARRSPVGRLAPRAYDADRNARNPFMAATLAL